MITNLVHDKEILTAMGCAKGFARQLSSYCEAHVMQLAANIMS